MPKPGLEEHRSRHPFVFIFALKHSRYVTIITMAIDYKLKFIGL